MKIDQAIWLVDRGGTVYAVNGFAMSLSKKHGVAYAPVGVTAADWDQTAPAAQEREQEPAVQPWSGRRFGLDGAQRAAIFREIDQGQEAIHRRYPLEGLRGTALEEAVVAEREAIEQLDRDIAQKYGLTGKQLISIKAEGIEAEASQLRP